MNKEGIYKEILYKAVRSSGAGGQHVNKVSSKVELSFDVASSSHFSELEKELLLKNLSSRLTKKGVLKLSSGESRSQHSNKEKVVKRLFKLLEIGLRTPTKRKPITISNSQKVKRLENKKQLSQKKNLRKKPNLE
ncbi:MAG: Peptidyl-tRNA hydrolase ArfB [Flavobacterium sp. SCGC AAA160-P02]|nr:MAG: Peptidyl-tRNA hydrolase ArfB [Flavobacterium sp. SCGC AAA160-P02]